ncbi:hypothetical protein [Hydrogenophaga sp.]|uniref:RIFT barrel domain-containing protein n=1 Tax=Hydrogenophaga sp. TaxID=1904254 RepID=UPI0035B247E5
MAIVAYPGTPGTVIYGGLPTPSGGTALTTITLANTSATEQSAGFVSPMFGLPLKQGDVPAGQYPAFFLADDTPVPATIHSVTSWPDGSMKWCGVFLRVPAAVPGSGTLAITVKNGGSAPGASARAVSDLTAADLKVELTGVTNLTGTWTASLNDAITNGTVVVIGDGPAGMLVRILGDFKQSGSAHGQLVNWHYALIAQNSSGGLLGIRYLGRVAQPWAEVVSPAPALRSFSAALKTGETVFRAMQGVQSGETLGSTISLPHYGRIDTCGTSGKWDFFQAGGSASADCSVRVVFDKTYFTATKIIPPYDLAVDPTPQAAADYYPSCSGGMIRPIGNTGERRELGVLPDWAVKHLLLQDADSEQRVRVASLAVGGWRTGVRKAATKNIIPCADVSPSYTGLGPVETNWRYWAVPNNGDMPNVGVEGYLWSGDLTTDHRPGPCYYAYLITGEPQHLDLLIENAAEAVLVQPIGSPTVWTIEQPIVGAARTGQFHNRTATINGVDYKGAGILFYPALTRDAAWALRDIAQCAAICPDVPPDGANVKGYFKDVVESNLAAFNAYRALMPTSYQNAGLFCLIPAIASNEESPWTYAYLVNSLCHAKSILSPSGVDGVLESFAKYWQTVTDTYDIAACFAYRMYPWSDAQVRANTMEECVFRVFDCTISFDTGTQLFTKAGTNSGFSVTNGDVFMVPSGATKPFASAVDYQRFYAVESTGSTWKLAASPGGAAETISTTGTWSQTWVGLQSFSPRLTYENVTSSSGYMANVRGCMRQLEAVGVTAASAARALADANIVAAGTSFSDLPKNAMALAYPG